MIGRITGLLAEKNPPELLVDCQGVGYELQVPMSTFYNLPPLGDKVSLLTHFVVREDAQILYGFGSSAERAAFRQLIKIAGVGPRTALSVLSGMSVDELSRAISSQEAGRLTKVPGIGKKTALRLVLHLLKQTPDNVSFFTQAINKMREEIQRCSRCNNVSDSKLCGICANTMRKQNIICVVGSVTVL